MKPQVEFAEPNFLISKNDLTPNDPQFNEQWALRNTGQNGGQYGADINASGAWQTTTGSSATVIAVIDSGIDFTHPDLANNQWTNLNPTLGGDLHGWDYIADNGVIKDEQGHGTAVAGIIAAEGNNSAGVSGVMWRASLMSLRVLDQGGNGDVADAVEAIDYAVTNGAQVINLSWGTVFAWDGKQMVHVESSTADQEILAALSARDDAGNWNDWALYRSLKIPILVSYYVLLAGIVGLFIILRHRRKVQGINAS